ncbi:MAG: type II secretion system protein [Bacilli bacterium]|nr:type II secretion system protein [Bacilli bacterium]
MKKMNKKGFTLIELLAVIVILAIIMVIAVPQILNVINSSRESAWTNNVKLIARSIETNDSIADVNSSAGTKSYATGGCTDANVKQAGDIDETSTQISTDGTTSGVCKITATPIGQFAASGNKTATIECSATGCSISYATAQSGD